MRNKMWMYVGGAIFVLLLIGSFVVGSGVLNRDTIKSSGGKGNSELERYRSEDIPEDCRLPEYESDVDWWKQHLSHHEATYYCLDYYK